MVDDIDREIITILISNGRISALNIVKRLAENGVKMSERGIVMRKLKD